MDAHILIVDDDAMTRSFYLHLFNAEGYRVSSASDGMEALIFIENTDDIDLIITDLEMPHMSGMELIRSLKEKNKNLPFLIISGTLDEEAHLELNDLGCKHYLSKPVRLPSLRESVKKILERSVNGLPE